MLDGVSQDYLLDAFVFPGNSSGPVILKAGANRYHGYFYAT
jgi:hypothetical protein